MNSHIPTSPSFFSRLRLPALFLCCALAGMGSSRVWAQVDGGHGEVAGGVGKGFFEKWLGIEDDLLWTGRLAYHPNLHWGLELQVERVQSHDALDDEGGRAHFTFWGLGGIVPLRPTRALSPYLSLSLGVATLDLAHTTHHSAAVGLGAGAQWHFQRNWALFGEFKDDLAQFRGNTTHQILFSAGLRFAFGFGGDDQDGDGVTNAYDRCPDTPQGAVVDERGCSSDQDADGVADGIDRCPDTPIGTPVDAKGCPR